MAAKTRWWLATYSLHRTDDPYEVQYEPHTYKLSKNALPDDEPWAIYNADFFLVACSPDWGGVFGPETKDDA